MRTALYIRVSTEKQEATNQLIQLRDYCKKKSFNIVEEYVDVISGKETSRPAFDKMFRDAHSRSFDLLLFWALDRFSRAGTLFTLQKLKELENLGIDWVSYQEPYFNTIGQFKDVVLSIMATIGKMERERISERTKAGLMRSPKRHLIGKRGKDKKPRRRRSDRGIKRTISKKHSSFIKETNN